MSKINLVISGEEVKITPDTRKEIIVDISEVSKSEILDHFKIEDIIEHFGIPDILDEIGIDESKSHFDLD